MKTCQNCSAEIQDTFNFCPNCGSDLGKPIDCPKCKYPNEPNSKFCQECGISLFEKYKPKEIKTKDEIIITEIPSPPLTGITIEFPYSSAQSFEFAVMEAKKFDTFEQFGKEKKAIFRINVFENELYKTKELLEHLKGWRKRTVYHNGEKVMWDSMFSFQWCYEHKLASYKPEYYCFGYEDQYDFNLWGCMKAGMPFVDHANWFTFGKWLNNKGDWMFDKEQIKHELIKNVHYCKFCPAINLDLIQDIVTALPNVINPTVNKNWKFKQTYNKDSGNILSATTREYGFEQNEYYDGVVPNGKAFIKDIAENIRKKLPDFIK
jgi:hypothetical protein